MPSTVAGYLTPNVAPAPLMDDAFENFIQLVLVGISGLPGAMVRPAFQLEPPPQPDRETDWLAFSIVHQDADVYAITENLEATTDFERHETVQVLLSSYGPNAQRTLALLRDGFQVEQNRAVMTANGMGLQETGRMQRAPSLIKDKWLNRYDMSLIFRRQIRRSYAIESLLTAQVDLHNDLYNTHIIVEEND